MSRLYLTLLLASRDLRRRTGEALMLVIVITAATAALSLGLMLRGVMDHPYQTTRTATAGPDELATSFPAGAGPPTSHAALRLLAPLARAQDVTKYSGPFPVAFPVLTAHGRTDAVLAEGRGQAPADVDQPELTQGSWVRPDAIVVERSFADALGIRAGDEVTLNGRLFRVAGLAVTAAFPVNGIGFLESSARWPNPGLIWMTKPDATSLATRPAPLGYVMNLKLADPAAAQIVADRFDAGGYTDNTGGLYVIPWQMISDQDSLLITHEQKILITGSWLLALLAIASLAVLVGGRMAEQTRRAGLLKAVGGTPALVAGVLLAEYLALAIIASAAGLAAGRLSAPLLTNPGQGLLGAAGSPQLTPAVIGLVTTAALTVAALASFFPALRAARASTVDALANAARRPRRHPRITAISARLPVPLLLAARLAARRPRRMLLAALSISVTVSGIVAVLFAHATLAASQLGGYAGPAGRGRFDIGFISQVTRQDQVLLVLTIMLAALAAVNAIFITWAAVQDSRHTSVVARALGTTPGQLTAALSAAQIFPATAGALAGIAGGYGLFTLANQGGTASPPPAWWLIAAVAGTLVAVAALTFIPARLGTRHPVAAMLQRGKA